MLPCKQCHSSGVTTCPACGGVGEMRPIHASGEAQLHACPLCEGKKRLRCDDCGGLGWLGADNAPVLVAGLWDDGENARAVRWNRTQADLAVSEQIVSADW